MKKSDLKKGDKVIFTEKGGGNVYSYWIKTSTDPINSRTANPPYGTSIPIITRSNDIIYECIEEGTESTTPYIVKLDEKGLKTRFLYAVYNCAGLKLVTDDYITNKVKLTSRQTMALKIREDNKKTEEQIKRLEGQIVELKEKLIKDEATAAAYERYETDDEALAAMLAEVMKTEGDPTKILSVLKKTGVTMRL